MPHGMHLESLHHQLIGFHIHDVQFPGRDHCAPGTGSLDFAALKRFVRPDHIKVFEFSPSITPDDAKRGVEYLKGVWGKE
jgi:sugar phosphate isomerase/epimerase